MSPPSSAVPSYTRVAAALAVALGITVLTLHDVAVERGGPGVTCDELYHVGYGKRLVSSLLRNGVHFFARDCIRQTFAWSPDGPPVHPPLGNWILGWFHWMFDPAPQELSQLAITPARFGTAVCFGVLVFLVCWAGIYRYGLIGGLAAGCSLVLMPRLFGHAHLAALDAITVLMCTATVLAVVVAERSGRWWAFALAGSVWGLALLTRFHGLLCSPPILLWIFWRRRSKGIVPAFCWLASGLLIFYIGWPWLWFDTLQHVRLYVSTSTQRTPIHVFYLGRVWEDSLVPRHYVWVMFLATMPVGLLLAGGIAIFSHWSSRSSQRNTLTPAPRMDAADFLFLGTMVFFLAIFTGPRVPVYDGVRLFLPVYSMWALLVGRGTQVVWEWISRVKRLSPPYGPSFLLGSLLALQAVGVVSFRPVWLSYYNLLVGGLAGAERLGFEVNYWGDALTEPLLAAVAHRAEKGETLVFGPSLAPYQAAGILLGSPSLAEKEMVVVGWPAGAKTPPKNSRWIVIYHRRADLDQIPEEIRQRAVISEISCQGVWLARLIQLPVAGTDGSP
ncbi:glycosyltransferase family 39 protein [Thermogutta sp.]|uniref:ArnT family glycosyltransferase n=1 Tax=Thermogutta sp. TaxID=1962930 RepID=UPI00321F6960